jgi:uncharacterized repeat protein (TIGR01451 family)
MLVSNTFIVPAIAAPHAAAGLTISNKIIVTYKDNNGITYTDESNIITITIRAVDSATLTNDSGNTLTSAAIPNHIVYTLHTLHNTGNTKDSYTFSANNDAAGDTLDATNLLIYNDANKNGQLDPAENTPINSIELISDQLVKLLVATQLPAVVDVSDSLHITVDAVSDNGGTVTTTNHVNITFTNDNIANPIRWEAKDLGNCHAYQVINSASTWQQAKTSAEAMIYDGKTGHLLTLSNNEETNFITTLMSPTTAYYIGAKRLGSGWSWVNNQTWNYENWDAGQPDNAGGLEDVIEIYNSGKWGDIAGTTQHNFIVEFDIDCIQPKVEVVLQAAKDTDCDDQQEGDFGTVNLLDMAPNECLIFDIKAENTSTTNANEVMLSDPLPEFTSYKANTLRYCKGDGCTLQTLTDAVGDDSAEYDATNGETKFIAGTLIPNQKVFARFSIRID